MDHHSDSLHNQIIEAIRASDVICLAFPRFGKTLIIDLRSTIETPPAVMIDDMMDQPSDRLDRMEQMRPTLPVPDEVRIAPWTGSVTSLDDAGITHEILSRCAQAGDSSIVQQCRDAFQTLARYERRHVRAIVRGDNARTIWQRGE